MRKLPYLNNNFDKIFCVWSSFNHLFTPKDQIISINQCYRVLKPKGVAFFEMINGERKEILKKSREYGKGAKGSRIYGPEFFGRRLDNYIHSRKTLIELCKRSKFKKYTVGFCNVSKRRRLVVYLYK